MHISKLNKVPLRELWKHEEYEFTTWLENNIDYLSELLGFGITIEEREKRVGSFKLDLFGIDEFQNTVIIENQLEQTNHEHLGKLLTYFTNLDAKVGIWITSDSRQEHSKVIEWLNEITPDDVSFYLIKLEAYKIEDSPAAPLFTIIAGPSFESKDIGREKKDLSERHNIRLQFWKGLLNKIKEKGIKLHSNCSPSKDNWILTTAGISGIRYGYLIFQEDQTAIELVIETPDKDKNKIYFDKIFEHRVKIENEFGDELSWSKLDNNIKSKITYYIKNGGIKDTQDKWEEIQNNMIEKMMQFSKVFSKYVNSFK